MRRHLISAWWTARSVAEGRLFFEGGGSDRVGRLNAWRSLRPMPGMWLALRLMRLTPGHMDRRECGCTYWFGRRHTVCLDHLSADLGLGQGGSDGD